MRVLIDGVEAKLVDERVTLPLYRFSSLRSVEGWREGESVVRHSVLRTGMVVRACTASMIISCVRVQSGSA